MSNTLNSRRATFRSYHVPDNCGFYRMTYGTIFDKEQKLYKINKYPRRYKNY